MAIPGIQVTLNTRYILSDLVAITHQFQQYPFCITVKLQYYRHIEINIDMSFVFMH